MLSIDQLLAKLEAKNLDPAEVANWVAILHPVDYEAAVAWWIRVHGYKHIHDFPTAMLRSQTWIKDMPEDLDFSAVLALAPYHGQAEHRRQGLSIDTATLLSLIHPAVCVYKTTPKDANVAVIVDGCIKYWYTPTTPADRLAAHAAVRHSSFKPEWEDGFMQVVSSQKVRDYVRTMARLLPENLGWRKLLLRLELESTIPANVTVRGIEAVKDISFTLGVDSWSHFMDMFDFCCKHDLQKVKVEVDHFAKDFEKNVLAAHAKLVGGPENIALNFNIREIPNLFSWTKGIFMKKPSQTVFGIKQLHAWYYDLIVGRFDLNHTLPIVVKRKEIADRDPELLNWAIVKNLIALSSKEEEISELCSLIVELK